MTKYLCVDTNILIQTCLLEIEEGDDIDVLKKLHKLLDDDILILLLPEVVKLEFDKLLKRRANELRNKIGEYKKQVNEDNFHQKIKNDINLSLEDVLKKREVNTEKVTKEIDDIFNHKNTKKLELTPKIFTDSYKYYLSGKKPYNEKKGFLVSSDSLIIQTLEDFFESKNDYELYFCSNNVDDFSNEKSKSLVNSSDVKIHKDIEERFKHIEYFRTLFDLINKFGGEYSPESIEKFKAIEFEDGVSPSASVSPSVSPSSSPFPGTAVVLESLVGRANVGLENTDMTEVGTVKITDKTKVENLKEQNESLKK